MMSQVESNVHKLSRQCQWIQEGILNPSLNHVKPSIIGIKEAQEIQKTQNEILFPLGLKLAYNNVTDIYSPL